jgi:chromate transporter
MKKKSLKTYLWLFGINFFISAFTFGGGYVVISMIRKYYVQKKNLITEEELLDMAAVAQSSPGAIAVNMSSLAGFRIGGIGGAIISLLGSVAPPFFILALISSCYTVFRDNVYVSAVLKGMEAGVAALIVDVIIDMCKSIWKQKSWFYTLLVPLAFIANFIFNVNVMIVILSSVVVCLIWSFIESRRERKCGVK